MKYSTEKSGSLSEDKKIACRNDIHQNCDTCAEMNLHKISLVEKENIFFLMDGCTCDPFVINHNAYTILSALKKGTDKKKLIEDFGEAIVTNTLKSLQTLQKSDNDHDRLLHYEDACKTISNFRNEKISLLQCLLMVVQSCNLACSYCYGGDSGQYHMKGFMSKSMAEKCFHYFLSNSPDNMDIKLLFVGGEPLLNMEVIEHVIDLWEKLKYKYPYKKLSFALTTNGTLLTPSITAYLIEKKVSLAISLDGPEDIHNRNRIFKNGQGTFNSVMAGIELLRMYKAPFVVRVTISRHTDLDRLFDFLGKQNFDATYISTVDYPMLKPDKDYQLDMDAYNQLSKKQQELLHDGCRDILEGKKGTFQAKQMGIAYHRMIRRNKAGFPFKCLAGWHICTFGIKGDIYLCQSFVGNERFCLGNVNKGIDKEKVVKLYMDFLNASRMCDSCWALPMCERSCFYQKAKPAGGFDSIPEDICNIYRDNIASMMVRTAELQKHKYGSKTNQDIKMPI